MKKLLLATAIAALSVSAANAAPTIYGKAFLTGDFVNAEIDFDNDWLAAENIERATTNKPLLSDEDSSSLQLNSNGSRIGFKGSEPLTANTDLIYKLEYGIDIDGDKDDTFTRRDTYLGVANNGFGELRFGHNTSVIDYVNNVTVTHGFWDNLGTNNDEPTIAETLTMADAERRANSIVWMAPKYEGLPLEVALMYGADESFVEKADELDDGFGATIMFDQGTGFTAGLGYSKDLDITGDIIRGSITYDAAKVTGMPLMLGAMYQQADYDGSDDEEQGFVISGELGLANFARPASIYAQYNNVSDLAGIKDLDSDQFVIGGKYMYRNNMILHAYAGANTTEANKVADADVFAIGGGLEYKF